MNIQIESTEKIVQLRERSGHSVPARIWEGHTESGIAVHCYVTRVAVKEGQPPEFYEQFERELKECRKPSADVEAIPMSMIL